MADEEGEEGCVGGEFAPEAAVPRGGGEEGKDLLGAGVWVRNGAEDGGAGDLWAAAAAASAGGGLGFRARGRGEEPGEGGA